MSRSEAAGAQGGVAAPYRMLTLWLHRIAGTSGQTIDNMKQYMTVEEPLTLLEMTLHLRHWAPTAPDTLAAYPFYDSAWRAPDFV